MPTALTKSEALRPKRRAREVRRRRLRLLGLVALLLIAAVSWAVVARAGGGVDTPLRDTATDATALPVASGVTAHPVFARINDKNLVLPVDSESVSVIAYHSVNNESSVALSPLGERVDGNLVARGVERVIAGPADIRYHVLQSRGRVVTETGAVDVGAPAGSMITSPVTGEVVSVRAYKLYGKYDDYQVDIRPKSLSDVIVSLLLVEDPRVHINQTVEAGKTVIGVVRAPIPELAERLTSLTGDTGSHVHLQVTSSPAPLE